MPFKNRDVTPDLKNRCFLSVRRLLNEKLEKTQAVFFKGFMTRKIISMLVNSLFKYWFLLKTDI